MQSLAIRIAEHVVPTAQHHGFQQDSPAVFNPGDEAGSFFQLPFPLLPKGSPQDSINYTYLSRHVFVH